ncbi:hypothetical protein IKB17_07045 [bacterium]|nr:hypothetical protein [bacterium]
MVEKKQNNDIYNANDTLDINELASLNDDISTEFIEQLQNQIALNASEFTGKPILEEKDDSELFEERIDTSIQEEKDELKDEKANKEQQLNLNIDDNFIKKYKAKLNKQEADSGEQDETKNSPSLTNNNDFDSEQSDLRLKSNADIKELSGGNIIERPLSKEEIEYNESLDRLDDNIKYSKYVIYINPENTEFIDSLTVKERKNLINRILKEQNDIAITKKRFKLILSILKHILIAIITLSISIPAIYWTINSSLEASINNYRRSKTIFKTLYKEKGKIQKKYNH